METLLFRSAERFNATMVQGEGRSEDPGIDPSKRYHAKSSLWIAHSWSSASASTASIYWWAESHRITASLDCSFEPEANLDSLPRSSATRVRSACTDVFTDRYETFLFLAFSEIGSEVCFPWWENVRWQWDLIFYPSLRRHCHHLFDPWRWICIRMIWTFINKCVEVFAAATAAGVTVEYILRVKNESKRRDIEAFLRTQKIDLLCNKITERMTQLIFIHLFKNNHLMASPQVHREQRRISTSDQGSENSFDRDQKHRHLPNRDVLSPWLPRSFTLKERSSARLGPDDMTIEDAEEFFCTFGSIRTLLSRRIDKSPKKGLSLHFIFSDN